MKLRQNQLICQHLHWYLLPVTRRRQLKCVASVFLFVNILFGLAVN